MPRSRAWPSAPAALSGDSLDRFAEDLDELARTSSMTSMSKASQSTLTEAITACAGG